MFALFRLCFLLMNCCSITPSGSLIASYYKPSSAKLRKKAYIISPRWFWSMCSLRFPSLLLERSHLLVQGRKRYQTIHCAYFSKESLQRNSPKPLNKHLVLLPLSTMPPGQPYWHPPRQQVLFGALLPPLLHACLNIAHTISWRDLKSLFFRPFSSSRYYIEGGVQYVFFMRYQLRSRNGPSSR